MRKIKILSTLLILAMIVASSCTDLEEEPFSVMTKDNYFQDEESITRAILRVYEHGSWHSWGRHHHILEELTADHMVWTQKGKHGYDDGQWVRMHDHTWATDDPEVYSGWTGPFQGIGQINMALSDIKELDYSELDMVEEKKDAHIAELKALRGWFYMDLLNWFREVPIVETVDDLKEQSSPEEVFNFIESDLTDALENLPEDKAVGRFDKEAVAGLLVRLYLNAEVWIDEPMYDQCEEMARDIINGEYGGHHSLDDDYRGPFRSGTGYESPENLMEIPNKKDVNDPGYMYSALQHYQAYEILDTEYGGYNGPHLQPSRDLEGNIYTDFELGKPYEKFSDDDKRKQPFVTTSEDGDYEGFFLVGPQYEFDDSKGYGYDSTEIVEGTEEYNGEQLEFRDQVGRFSEGEEGLAEGSSVLKGEENSGIRVLKFPWLPKASGESFNNNFPEMRLAEMYYTLAECEFRDGNIEEAAELLDEVRERNFPEDEWSEHSYQNNPSELTEQEFIDEWGREFFSELRRRTDLIRWGRFGDQWWDKEPDSEDKTVFPIPRQSINANDKLEQTQWGN
ncbi:MAG: RagB/SusD family nutrient uptake outer membrane protein [Bacteroidota bacterium]